MTNVCNNCGARRDESQTCQSIFDGFLAMEFSDPAYGRVHMLTVACFMIQHNRYSNAGLAWMTQQLRNTLERGEPLAHIGRKAVRETQNSRREWKVLRGVDESPLPRVAWSMTIADVARGQHDAESYCRLVEAWARCVMEEMAALFEMPGN